MVWPSVSSHSPYREKTDCQQSTEECQEGMLMYSRHPFLWPRKPGTPIAKPDIFLVTSYHLRSVRIRMSLRKKQNCCVTKGGEEQ